LFTTDLITIVLRIPALLIAITFHEFAHARMAYHFGDSTAKDYGRMSLNPLKHLDPIGTLMILLVGFGWAKPVPINPYRFRSYRSGMLWVSFAGPLANFLLAFVSLFLFYALAGLNVGASIVYQLVSIVVQLNILLGVFNLIPIPPLDGSKILTALAPRSMAGFFRQIEPYAPILLLFLIMFRVFDLIIIPVFNIIFNLFNSIVLFFTGSF
jgi:Zn-dependent protease